MKRAHKRLAVLRVQLNTCKTAAVNTAGQISLVIGGSGPTGIHLIEGLIARGHTVYMLHSGTHKPDADWYGAEVRVLIGNAFREDSLVEVLDAIAQEREGIHTQTQIAAFLLAVYEDKAQLGTVWSDIRRDMLRWIAWQALLMVVCTQS